ncbi:hypothetical protein Glove_114g147 [Diversispora epigaea]|uniref:Protein kinase domain-containing protein n=1 Tax=Diversispora epigaea TaxID=1348612 RepID=A0A397JA60_9GLOM|nr:hypothetical protein Glove_114g147 [Diversispora epigaea]
MYKLGDIFYNGKLGVKEDKEMGIELYKLAAMMNKPGAMEFLNSIKINFGVLIWELCYQKIPYEEMDLQEIHETLTKYWKGYYLQNGYYGRKEPKEALKLFKAAADEGVPDAKLSYAIESIKLAMLILHHLVQATSGRNETAMYKLGDIFYNGKLGVKEDKEMGIELYKLAAMMNKPGAMEFLNSIKINYSNIRNDTNRQSIAFTPFMKCKGCQQENTGLNWCNFCNSKRFQTEFDKWTSHDKEIDQYIQQMQLNAKRFLNGYHLKGGFGKVFKAKWLDGFITSWDRKTSTKVQGESVIVIYGITKDPEAKNYIIVMQYAKYGRLRKMMNKRFKFLTWKEKIEILLCKSRGLNRIHKIGLVRKDFQPGNIVSESLTNSYIIDFGLCKPVSENNDDIIIGVLPKEYTQALDVYSFGMIMLEVFTSYPPYYNIRHDEKLVTSICEGKKPEIKYKIPLLLKDLMEQCWNIDPRKRPTSEELLQLLVCYCHEDDEIGLVRKDFQPGNIVSESLTNSYIIDFGLCKPVSENNDDIIIGVLPKEYTQALDVYSFGMIMLEVFTSYPPYYNIRHDEKLVTSICEGKKPEIKYKIPLLLKDLMEQCWNIDPRKRPTSEELLQLLVCYCHEDDEVLEKQINEADELNKDFYLYDPNRLKHPQAIHTSRLFLKKEQFSRYTSGDDGDESNDLTRSRIQYYQMDNPQD